MTFTVSFKTPDALSDVLEEIDEESRDRAKRLADRFVQWGERLTVEFDTEAGTATVLRVR